VLTKRIRPPRHAAIVDQIRHEVVRGFCPIPFRSRSDPEWLCARRHEPSAHVTASATAHVTASATGAVACKACGARRTVYAPPHDHTAGRLQRWCTARTVDWTLRLDMPEDVSDAASWSLLPGSQTDCTHRTRDSQTCRMCRPFRTGHFRTRTIFRTGHSGSPFQSHSLFGWLA